VTLKEKSLFRCNELFFKIFSIFESKVVYLEFESPNAIKFWFKASQNLNFGLLWCRKMNLSYWEGRQLHQRESPGLSHDVTYLDKIKTSLPFKSKTNSWIFSPLLPTFYINQIWPAYAAAAMWVLKLKHLGMYLVSPLTPVIMSFFLFLTIISCIFIV